MCEKLMQREKKDVFSLKSEGMDFNDVFGGPPKRFSMQEIGTRFSFDESEEETPWSEKPVFGDEVRGRRREGTDEFFNDIFKGVESYPSPSPRRSDHRAADTISNSASRIMSPHFPTSLLPPPPPHFSLPAIKVTKGIELPTSLPPPSHGENIFNHFHFSIYKWAGKGLPMLNDNSSGRPVKKKETQLLNQEMKDKKPQTPRVDDEIRTRKADRLKFRQVVDKKEFVQIFNQEGGDHDVVAAAKDKKKLPHVSFKVVEDLNNHQQPSHPSTNPNITISPETFHKDSKMSVENADDPLDDNFMVEEIFDAQENVGENESSCDDTNAIDAKIRQWSVGKKGNIRSLLSTLQYVLWAESGWKAVPLVDLIEANSVKRAYQKALLRLHPDKLQQKGAPFHHKYTAEKVFDILQEAWDHFNTCSSIV
ncbi:hypothetical protein ACS0TY_013567 [Phlomoides rotata]